MLQAAIIAAGDDVFEIVHTSDNYVTYGSLPVTSRVHLTCIAFH